MCVRVWVCACVWLFLCMHARVCVMLVCVHVRACVRAHAYARTHTCVRACLSWPRRMGRRCTHVGYSEYSNGVLGVLTQGTGSTHSGTRHRPVGVLSTMDRDAWAVARAELEANATNAKVREDCSREYPSSTPSVPLRVPLEHPFSTP